MRKIANEETVAGETDYSELLAVLDGFDVGDEDKPSTDDEVSIELDESDDSEESSYDIGDDFADALEVSDPPEESIAFEIAEGEPFADGEGMNIDDELSLILLDLPKGMLADENAPEEKVEEEDLGPQTWEDHGAHKDFINYLVRKVKSIPPHSGQTTVGCEKAVSYLRKLDKEISKAIQSDDDNVIDEIEAEKIRDTIHGFIEKLEEAYDYLSDKKRKKKKASFRLGKNIVARLDGDQATFYASVGGDSMEETLVPVEVVEPSDEQLATFASAENGLKKEAAFMTFMDPFLEAITRLLIRSHVTHGKDLRDVYGQLDSQYKFTDRESLSIHEILRQAGLGMHTDLGRLNEKNVNIFDGKNVEFSTTYSA